VLGVIINLKHTCFGAQVNMAIISVRFAVRAIANQSQFIFIASIKRETLPLADARELRLVALAENVFAKKRTWTRPPPSPSLAAVAPRSPSRPHQSKSSTSSTY
jgi:hypothetical protein